MHELFDRFKKFVRLVQAVNASKLELRNARAQFAATLEEQQYLRRQAERELVRATVIIRELDPGDRLLDHARDGREKAIIQAREFLQRLEDERAQREGRKRCASCGERQ